MIISHSKGRGEKIHLLIDDEYQITTNIDFWAENYIKDGTEISEDEWQELVDKINYRKAIQKCYDLLSRRDHSAKELKTKLLRTTDEKNADMAISKMLDLGYLNDEKYAKNLLIHLRDVKKMSSAFIRQEMYKRGISSDIVNDIMLDIEIDNVQSIIDLILTKYKTKLSKDYGSEKVIAALMRKGFSYSDIKEAFNRIDDEEYI